MSVYRYVIEQLSGERNIWADILTRWAVSPCARAKRLRVASLFLARISPSLSEEFDSLRRAELVACQKTAGEIPPAKFKTVDGLYQDRAGVFWIPTKASNLMKLQIPISSHTGVGGHRGISQSYDALKAHFQWSGMKADVDSFVSHVFIACAHRQVQPSPAPRACAGCRATE